MNLITNHLGALELLAGILIGAGVGFSLGVLTLLPYVGGGPSYAHLTRKQVHHCLTTCQFDGGPEVFGADVCTCGDGKTRRYGDVIHSAD